MKASEFHDEYWWPRCQRKLREVTCSNYDSVWRRHIEPTIGNMELEDVTPRFLDHWIEEKDVRPNTWRVLKVFLNTAFKYEMIDDNPCGKVLDPPKKKFVQPNVLNRAEMSKMLDGLSDTWVYPAIVCSSTMGLRREESCGLMWDDFDWDTGKVSIKRAAQYLGGKEVIVDPKTPLSKRTIPVPFETRMRLKDCLGEGRIIGKHNAHQIADRYRDLCKYRDLPYVPMTKLRTSWCTIMLNEGAPVTKVSRYMGHSDVTTTVRYYAKPREDDLDEVATLWDSNPLTFQAALF